MDIDKVTLVQINERLQEQVEKWGPDRDQEDTRWLTILAEETGEAAEAILATPDTPWCDLYYELIDVIAVAISWMQAIDRR